jgi:hypothetical protein
MLSFSLALGQRFKRKRGAVEMIKPQLNPQGTPQTENLLDSVA